MRVARSSDAHHAIRAPNGKARDGFVAVNGVKLHYVDWGGRGETILFLTGLGDSAHRFDALAARFTDRFHVLGLPRRGQGESAKPTSGYDTGTLAEDIKAFLDAMRIERVNLVSHSVAGAEMTRFAGKYPRRLAKLVYLDAANDYVRIHELEVEAHLPPPRVPSLAAILRRASESHPVYARVTAPALAFFVAFDTVPVSPQDDEAYTRYLQLVVPERLLDVEQFRREMKHGQIITLHDTSHFFFEDPKQIDGVVRDIRDFLSQ